MLPIEAYFVETKARLDIALRNGSYSFGFLADIAVGTFQGRYDSDQIVDEVAFLEGHHGRSSKTKAAKLFRKTPLQGYWHKHFSQANYMAKNLWNEMLRDKTLPKFFTEHAGETMTPENARLLTQKLVSENYFRRMNEARLTGEWIIFEDESQSRRYITLANHAENNEVIAERIVRHKEIDRIMSWDCRRSKLQFSPNSSVTPSYGDHEYSA